MRHGLGRSLIVLAIFAAAFLVFSVFLADRESRAGLLGLLRGMHRDGGTVARQSAPGGQGYTLAQAGLLERTPVILKQIDDATHYLVESVMPAVVRIDTTRKVQAPADAAFPAAGRVMQQPYDEPGLGSGVIISEEGHVMTNYHVVAGVDEIIVRTWDGAQLLGTFVGFDADMDIALLKIEDPGGRRFHPLRFGNSDELEVGHMVMAVGSPMGLTNSVTTGIVSGRYQQLDETIVPLIVTTAIINPGSSGGPLINSRSELIGINAALYAVDHARKSAWQGIGLAIPGNEALRVFYRIMSTGHQTGYIGVTAEDLQATPDTRFGAEPQTAVMIKNVKHGTPAEVAGILPGDIVLSFAERKIHSTNQLFPLVREHAVGATVPIVVFRGGQEIRLSLVIASLEEVLSRHSLGNLDRVGRLPGPQDVIEAVGIKVGDFTPNMRRELHILPDSPGILVKEIDKGSQLSGKLRQGDIIERLNDFFIYRAHDFHEKVNSLEPGVPLTIWFKRDGNDHSVTIQRVE